MKISLPLATTMWYMFAVPVLLVNVARGESVVTTTCTETMILEGTCLDACTCPCGNGLGVLVDPVANDLDCDKPKSVCMDPIVAYEFVLDQSGAWYVYLRDLITLFVEFITLCSTKRFVASCYYDAQRHGLPS